MLTALIFAGFGLIVGSFLNVLIIRHGVRSVGGRSACMACGRQLSWSDMIPVVSWIALSGKCRHCFARISIQYPLVEATTALLFGLIGGSPFPGDVVYRLLFCAIGALLIAIAVYDLRHTIIPDAWAYAFAGLAFVVMGPLLLPLASPEASILLYLLAGPLAASPLFFLWLVSRGRWMGLGDAKLALGIGWLLGPVLGIIAVFFAFVIGPLVSVPLVFFSSEQWRNFVEEFTPTPISRRLVWGFTMTSEIPFGPFLIFSCTIIWLSQLYGVDLNFLFALSL